MKFHSFSDCFPPLWEEQESAREKVFCNTPPHTHMHTHTHARTHTHTHHSSCRGNQRPPKSVTFGWAELPALRCAPCTQTPAAIGHCWWWWTHSTHHFTSRHSPLSAGGFLECTVECLLHLLLFIPLSLEEESWGSCYGLRPKPSHCACGLTSVWWGCQSQP